MELDQLLGKIYFWVDTKSLKKNYPFFLAITLIAISLFLAFPRFDLYSAGIDPWNVTALKAHDLTNSLTFIPPDSFMAKKVFRLTLPVIIRIFHLNRETTLAFQFVIGFFFLLFSYKLALRIMKDAVAATFLTAGFVFLYAGRACFTEINYTLFDGWGYFFLLMAIYNKKIFPVFFFATLASWTDERAFIAIPIAILFHQIETDKPDRFQLKGLISFNKSSIAVIAAIACYLLLRFYLSATFNMHTPTDRANLVPLKLNVMHASFGFGMYTFLEGFWLLLPIFLIIAFNNRHYLFATLVLAQIALSSVIANSVYDITRSGSYMICIVFVFLIYLSNFMDSKYFKPVLFVCMFFSFLFPPMSYVSFGDFLFRIEKPFLWVIMSLLTGHIK